MPTLKADAERVVAWLRTVRFCDGLDSEQLAAIASQIHMRPFVAGETLASAGDEVTEFWIVVEGELDSFLTDRPRTGKRGSARSDKAKRSARSPSWRNRRLVPFALLRGPMARCWWRRRRRCTSGSRPIRR